AVSKTPDFDLVPDRPVLEKGSNDERSNWQTNPRGEGVFSSHTGNASQASTPRSQRETCDQQTLFDEGRKGARARRVAGYCSPRGGSCLCCRERFAEARSV